MKLQETRRYQLASLFIALVLALTMYPTEAQAQITGDLEADIPFQFHAGNTKVPPGKYTIHVVDNSALTTMEISSADGSSSALFEVRDAQNQSGNSSRDGVHDSLAGQLFHEPVQEIGVH